MKLFDILIKKVDLCFATVVSLTFFLTRKRGVHSSRLQRDYPNNAMLNLAKCINPDCLLDNKWFLIVKESSVRVRRETYLLLPICQMAQCQSVDLMPATENSFLIDFGYWALVLGKSVCFFNEQTV